MVKSSATAALMLAWFLSPSLSAQTFQNNDTVLESRTVSPDLNAGGDPDPQSIACGQYNDDNGDGQITAADFLDCTALEGSNVPIGSPEPEPAICTLLNTGVQNNAPTQFNDGYSQTTGDPIVLFTSLMGSIRAGALDGSGPDDVVALVAGLRGNQALPLRAIANADFITNTGSACTNNNPPLGASTETDWQITTISEQGTLQGEGERGLELFDCDGDGDLDSVVAVSNAGDSNYYINVNLNSSGGLQPGPNQFDTTVDIGTDASFPSVLDVADFNGDGIPDVAFVGNGDDTDALAICYGDGTADDCSFTCNTQVNLDLLTNFNSEPTSIEAADFDGDGDTDVAIVLSDFVTVSLGYFFNDGNTAAAGPNFSAAASQLINVQTSPGAQPYAVTSGLFNLDDVPDAAVTNRVTPFSGTPSTVAVILSDGSGGFLPVETLNFPGAPQVYSEADAIAAGDFDHCGGDDIVVLAISANGVAPSPLKFGSIGLQSFKQAHFWYNVDEPPVVTATTPLTGDVSTPIALTATCSDPTDDDRTFAWTIVGPAGSTSSITPPNGALTGTAAAIAGSFQGDTPGDYTLTLTCNSCAQSAATTVLVTLANPAIPFTQGGCLADLSPTGGASGWASTVWGIGWLLPALGYGWKRRQKS